MLLFLLRLHQNAGVMLVKLSLVSDTAPSCIYDGVGEGGNSFLYEYIYIDMRFGVQTK